MLSENVRIKFAKVGKMKFISHLDLSRTMKSAFKRAGISLKYSEGFNPRPKLVFALTVSVGSESVCEFLDVTLTKEISKEDFIKGWQSAMSPDLEILDVYSPTTKFTELVYSKYEITFDTELDKQAVESAKDEPMVVKKHSKKGEKIEDIREGIIALEALGNKIYATLAASQGKYLNPEYLVKALADKGVSFEDYSIKRVENYFADMTVFS